MALYSGIILASQLLINDEFARGLVVYAAVNSPC